MNDLAQHPLALILARNLATNLRVPAFVTDGDGALVFANDAADGLLDDGALDVAAVALSERAPAHAVVDGVDVSALPIVSAEGVVGAIAFLHAGGSEGAPPA